MYNTVTGIESARTAGKYTAEHEKKESELDSFLDDLVKTSSGKKEFLTALIYAVNKKYYETALTVNDMRNDRVNGPVNEKSKEKIKEKIKEKGKEKMLDKVYRLISENSKITDNIGETVPS